MPESMVGRWAPLYRTATRPRPYGQFSPTYAAAAEWLAPCHSIEDWGAGLGWFGRFLRDDQLYQPIDGTPSRFVTNVADLATYRAKEPLPDGILLRHVLEHNTAWEQILCNALDSFRMRMAVVVFTPINDTQSVDLEDDTSGLNVPTISFDVRDLMVLFGDLYAGEDEYRGTHCGHYGIETMFMLERKD